MRPLPFEPRGTKAAIGERMRALRQARHMTIDQLAEVCGLSKGYVSRLERDLTSPSVATLITICDVLNVEVGELFRVPESRVVLAERAPRINLGGTNVEEFLATPRDESRMQLIRSRVPAGEHGTGGDEAYTINAELETLHVIAGRIEFVLGEEAVELGPGDSITFDGRDPHTWRTLDDAGAEFLWVLTPAAWSGSA